MKTATSLLVLGASALVAALVLAGCGGTEIAGIRGASIVPATAAAFVALDTDPDSEQWQNANELSKSFPSRDDATAELEASFSDDGLNWAEVEPALGPELDLVWLDFENDGENVVGLTQPDDPEAFEQVIAKGNESAAVPTDKLLYEQVDDWYVLSDSQAKIDAFKTAVEADGPVLADDEAFGNAMDDYSGGAIFKAYVSGKTVMDELRASMSDDDSEFVDKLGDFEWLALALTTSDEGIRFDATVRGTPGKLLQEASGASTPDFELSLPDELPKDVLAYLAFHGVASSLTDLENNPALRGAEMAEIRSLLRQVGVLLEGEGALYARPSEGDVPEITLVTKPRAGTDGAARVDSVLGDIDLTDEIQKTEVAGADARRLSVGGLELLYANVGDKLVVTTAPAGIESVVSPSSSSGEKGSMEDALDAAGVPDNVQSFFYVDIRGSLGLAEQLAGAPVPDAVRKNVSPLRSAVEYVASRPSEIQLTFFVRIDEPVETA